MMNDRKTYTGKITGLTSNQVFVFGSNPEGINGNPERGTGGAALHAYLNGWVGLHEKMDNCISDTGDAYGIVTVTWPGKKKSLTFDQIIANISKFYKFARQNPQGEFLVAYSGRTGKNLNGYTNSDLAKMFKRAAPIPNNVVFENEFYSLVAQAQSHES